MIVFYSILSFVVNLFIFKNYIVFTSFYTIIFFSIGNSINNSMSFSSPLQLLIFNRFSGCLMNCSG